MDPLSLALTLGPGIFKGITGLIQSNEDVKRVDTTPAAFQEALARQRLAAASGIMPGYAQAVGQLAQTQAASVRNAAAGAASSSDFLSAATAADGRQQQGMQALGVQNQKYQDVATQRLQQGLAQQATYQQADDNRYNQAKAALKGNGLSNIFGGLSDAASAGVYALNKGDGTYDPRNTDPRYVGANSYYDQMTPRAPKLATSGIY